MGYVFDQESFNKVICELSNDVDVFAPVLFEGGGIYSDTSMIRYEKITDIQRVVFDKKSSFSFKEVLLPIMQTLFYFTENQIQSSSEPKKSALVFLRHCDIHAVQSLDDMYLNNGFEDHYYQRVRDRIQFVVMGCRESFENCFCVSMKTNQSNDFAMSIDLRQGEYYVDCKENQFDNVLKAVADRSEAVEVDYVTENKVTVSIPENLNASVASSKMWDEYDIRCIACGRCNFVCPSCTCTTMQDIFYQDNGRTGERKRVWASCMVDGYTEVAGGHSCREKHGERMRFKVLHKVLNHGNRFGHAMCVGCGRCDDVCPEYISFSNAINKLEDAMKEVNKND